LIYFPDPEKDSDISVYEKHFKPGGKYSWSPSRRLLSTDYTKFGRTYFILKGVSREQFLRCVDPYNRRIQGKYVAEPSYRGITIRGTGIVEDERTSVKQEGNITMRLNGGCNKKPIESDYFLNALQYYVELEDVLSYSKDMIIKGFYKPTYYKYKTIIFGYVLPCDFMDYKFKASEYDGATVRLEPVNYKQYSIEVDDFNFEVIRSNLYHYSETREENYNKCKKHPVADYSDYEVDMFYRKKMNIFGDEIIVSVYKEYNHLVVITVTREEAKKLSTPKYEAIAEEINKYPQKLINRIKNKFELDDSTKGVYWLLVRLRQTENHGIKKMREKILDSREQNHFVAA